MAMKVQTLTEKNHVDSLRARLTEAQERIKELESKNGTLEGLVYQERSDLRSARGRINELSQDLEKVQHHNAELQREVGRLEGYKQRVERTDDLARNVPPIEHFGGNGNMAVDLSSYPRGNRPDVGWSGRQR